MGREHVVRWIVGLGLCVGWTCPALVAADGSLVFSRPGVGVMLQGDEGQDRVLYNQGEHVAPKLAPDADRVLYNSVEGGTMGVWVLDLAEDRKERLCDGGQAAWSPDGRGIVLERDGRLVARDLASGAETAIGPADAPALAFPSCLPDGRILCTDAAGRRVYVLSATADAMPEPVIEGEIHSTPRCAPDGSAVAYQDGAHVYVLDLVAGTLRQLTADPGVQGWPVWAADGASLCYARAPSVYAEAWTICHVTLAQPHEVRRIARRAHGAFDWRGTAPDAARTRSIPGSGLTIWRGEKPLAPKHAADLGASGDWLVLPEDVPLGPLAGSIAIENDWLVLAVSRKGSVLVSKASLEPFAIRLTDAAGRTADRPTEVLLAERSGDGVALDVAFAVAEGDPVTVRIRMPRTRPFVEVASRSNGGQVVLEGALALAVVPDRLANDVIVDPATAPLEGPVALPKTPVVLGCLPDSGGMVVAVTPAGQPVTLTTSADGTRLTGLTAALTGENVVLAVLDGPGLWQRTAADPDVRWQRPFYAVWRLAAQDETRAYARMWAADDISRRTGGQAPRDAGFADGPTAAVVYAWGRDAITPPDVLTPADVLVDVLGPDGYAETLDVVGVRGYRSADPWTPFRDLTTRPRGWHPAKANDDETDFGVLEVLGSVFPAGTDGVRSFVTSLGADAMNLLRGLDTRIAEYEQGLAALAAFCRTHADDGVLAALGSELDATLVFGRATPRRDVANLEPALEDLLAILGTRDFMTLEVMEAFCRLPGNEDWAEVFEDFKAYLAAKEGRLWHDNVLCHEIWYESEFKAFAWGSRRLLRERQRILTTYRERVKQACDVAARLMASDPDFKPLGDALRERAHAILRHRYYLEGDWRGETPLTNGGRR